MAPSAGPHRAPVGEVLRRCSPPYRRPLPHPTGSARPGCAADGSALHARCGCHHSSSRTPAFSTCHDAPPVPRHICQSHSPVLRTVMLNGKRASPVTLGSIPPIASKGIRHSAVHGPGWTTRAAYATLSAALATAAAGAPASGRSRSGRTRTRAGPASAGIGHPDRVGQGRSRRRRRVPTGSRSATAFPRRRASPPPPAEPCRRGRPRRGSRASSCRRPRSARSPWPSRHRPIPLRCSVRRSRRRRTLDSREIRWAATRPSSSGPPTPPRPSDRPREGRARSRGCRR